MSPRETIASPGQPVPGVIKRVIKGAAPTQQHAAARCTVGLLTWNAGADGVACVESVLAQSEGPLDLAWVDNASTDGTTTRLRERFPELPEPLVNPRNLGFCVGHNQALAACRTPYYLALNQDVTLAPETIEKLCDWMDERPELALVSGLILMPPESTKQEEPGEASGTVWTEERVYSAGLVFPRARFAFELGMGGPVAARYRGRRIVPGVDGSVMMLRVEACRKASLPEGEIFPSEFFAYGEEVDLAQRLARAGYACGVEGSALAWHRARGSGGFRHAAIRARFFSNHWLLTLRHDSWGTILRELPYLLRGEAQYWLPEYLQHPGALVLALGKLATHAAGARRFYHAFEKRFGPTGERLAAARAMAREELRPSGRTNQDRN